MSKYGAFQYGGVSSHQQSFHQEFGGMMVDNNLKPTDYSYPIMSNSFMHP